MQGALFFDLKLNLVVSTSYYYSVVLYNTTVYFSVFCICNQSDMYYVM